VPAAHPDFYVASRAHHADVGGAFAGSMGLCREIYQEGFRIPPVKNNAVRSDWKKISSLSCSTMSARPKSAKAIWARQLPSCQTGAERLRELCARYGVDRARRRRKICWSIPKN